MNWKVRTLNREGEVVKVQKKIYHSEAKANAGRNSLQTFWDKFYPDLGYHAQVVEIVEGKQSVLYRVYNGYGRWMGNFESAEAEKLVESHEDWTMTEVK